MHIQVNGLAVSVPDDPRTSLLDLVDRIIVIDSGKVVADGPKAQVVEALRQGRIGKAA